MFNILKINIYLRESLKINENNSRRNIVLKIYYLKIHFIFIYESRN